MWTDALLTYLVHSSLLLSGVWLLTTCVRNMPAAWRESLWRVALFGGVISASAQLALGYEPFGGHVALPVAAALDTPNDVPPNDMPARERAALEVHVLREVELPLSAWPAESARSESLKSVPAQEVAASGVSEFSAAKAHVRESRVPLLLGLALGWGLVVAALALRRWRGRRRLSRRLERRRLLEDGPLREILDRLCAQARFTRRLQLSEVADLGSPIAFGTRRPEIVVPARSRNELTPEQQEAMLAHELAHHVRADPRWLRAHAWVSGLLFFQPLNLLAQRRLGEAAELLADECAVSWTGRTRELAECLTAVARWAVYGSVPATASAMAQPGSMLERRVATLLQRRTGTVSTRRSLRLLALLPLVLVAVFAPAVSSRAAVVQVVPEAEAAPAQPRQPSESPVPEELRRLDVEISALEAEMTALLGLLDELTDTPPALTRGMARLSRHLAALVNQRNKLVSLTRTSLEETR